MDDMLFPPEDLPDVPLDELVASSYAIVEQGIEQYNPTHVFGLFSGGHDSLCACHVASKHPKFSGCIHINTGIGIEETREFVRQTCRDHGWPLWEYRSEYDYAEEAIKNGFPGPAQHWRMYSKLKERALRSIMRDHGERARKLAFVSGARRMESARRMNNAVHPIQVGPSPSNRAIWLNPIIEWLPGDKHRYIAHHGLRKNDVVAKLCMSGECLCGAFAKPNELDEIRMWYPATAEKIDRIADRVREAGQHAVWGTAPPGGGESCDMTPADLNDLPLCVSCGAKWAASQEEDS